MAWMQVAMVTARQVTKAPVTGMDEGAERRTSGRGKREREAKERGKGGGEIKDKTRRDGGGQKEER